MKRLGSKATKPHPKNRVQKDFLIRGLPEPSNLRSIFENEICDLPTHRYMLDERLVGILTPLISAQFQSEVDAIRGRLTAGSPPHRHNPDLRVALSNIALANLAGSELWVVDIAKYLNSAGVPVIVYSDAIGPVADMIISLGVEVTASVAAVRSFGPTIVHINHFEAAARLLSHLDGAPVIVNMIHGLLPRPGLPGAVGVDHYCCVSIHAKAKIHGLTGTPWADIGTLPNFFDERRFTEISNPHGARRALILSSRTPPERRDQLRILLSKLGFELDHFGYGGQLKAEPERWLANYDIIFAVGRSAIEGLASGAHVILWDFGVIGPAVTAANFWQCVASNFDLASNALPWEFIDAPGAAKWLRKQIDKLSPVSRMETTKLTRAYLPLSAAGCRLLDMYDQQLAGRRTASGETS